jgi:hypothetical protein
LLFHHSSFRIHNLNLPDQEFIRYVTIGLQPE